MALKLRVTPERGAYRPGDTLAVMVEVVTEQVTGAVQAAATHLEALQLELCASERVDVNWISSKYRAATQIIERDSRRIARPLLKMQAIKLCERTTLLPGSRRLYMIKLQLPESLPPSFRGSAARYSYQIEAKAIFAPQSWAGTPMSTAAPTNFKSQSSIPPAPDTPARSMQGDGGSSLGHPPVSTNTSRSSVRPNSREAGQQQRRGPGVVHVKAPIHIWPLPDTSDQAQPSGGIIAGEDAKMRITTYPVDQEAVDLCMDARDMLHAGGGSSGMPITQQQFSARPNGDAAAAPHEAHALAGQGKSATASEQSDEGAPQSVIEPPTPTANGGAETPMTSRARVARQGTRDAAGFSAASPSYAAGEGTSLRSYNLKVGDHPLVRISLHPPIEGQLQLGSTLAGTLDFRFSQSQQDAAAPKCVQVVIMLETEERVQDQWQAPSKRQIAPIRKVHDEHQELTPDTILTHFMFSLPSEESPSFSTHLIQHSWLLRFEFTTVYKAQPSGWGLSKAKAPETVSWLLPILVAPPSN